MNKKKKLLIIFIPIFAVALILLALYFYYGIHIYDFRGRIRGFGRFTSASIIIPKLKEIYGELPYEDDNGDVYEYINNFDNIDECDAIIKYCFNNQYHLTDVNIYLTSSKYSTDDLYKNITKKFRRIYGTPNIFVDKYGEQVGNYYWTISNKDGDTFINIYTDYFNNIDGSQICINFKYY